MEYWVAGSRNLEELVRIVNDAFDKGWQLQGGVAVAMTSNDVGTVSAIEYIQAMVRYD